MTILTWMHLIIHEYLIDFSMVSIILHGFQGACSAQQNFLPCFPSFLPSFLPSSPSSPSSPSLPFLSFSFLFLSFPPTSCYCFYTIFFNPDFFFDPDFFSWSVFFKNPSPLYSITFVVFIYCCYTVQRRPSLPLCRNPTWGDTQMISNVDGLYTVIMNNENSTYDGWKKSCTSW